MSASKKPAHPPVKERPAPFTGWRPSTPDDCIIWALVQNGPQTIRQISEYLDAHMERQWVLAHGGAPGQKPGRNSLGDTTHQPGNATTYIPEISYQGIYMRLGRLQEAYRIKREGIGKNGANLFHALTKVQREELLVEERAKVAIPAQLAQAARDAAASIGAEVEFGVEMARHGWFDLIVVVTTPRGTYDCTHTLNTNSYRYDKKALSEGWKHVLEEAGLR